jgi:hypothetical protein
MSYNFVISGDDCPMPLSLKQAGRKAKLDGLLIWTGDGGERERFVRHYCMTGLQQFAFNKLKIQHRIKNYYKNPNMFRAPRPISRNIIYFEGNKVMLFFVYIYFRLKGYCVLRCPTFLSLPVSAVHGLRQVLSCQNCFTVCWSYISRNRVLRHNKYNIKVVVYAMPLQLLPSIMNCLKHQQTIFQILKR